MEYDDRNVVRAIEKLEGKLKEIINYQAIMAQSVKQQVNQNQSIIKLLQDLLNKDREKLEVKTSQQ